MTPTQAQAKLEETHQAIDRLESSALSSQNSAASTLEHYFRLSISGFDSDNSSEIKGIVEEIIDAAVAKAKAEILRDSLSDKLPSCEFDPN